MHCVLRVGIPISDDEVMQEFDRTKGQTQKDIYNATWRFNLSDVSDSELEEDGPQPKRIGRSTRPRNSGIII